MMIKDLIEYSNDMQEVYKNIEEYNSGKKRKVLIVFVDMIADMINNKKIKIIITELLIRSRKLESETFLFCLLHSHISKCQINTTHFFIMKIPTKRQLQQIAINDSSDFGYYKSYIKIYKKYTAEPFSFLVNDTSLLSGNVLRFRKNLLK